MAKRPLVKKKKSKLLLPELRARLTELEETLDAIRSGEVDALIVDGPHGNQVYTLKGADEPYRIFIEQMRDGAITVDARGGILFANLPMSVLVATPLEKVIGSSLFEYIAPEHVPLVKSLLKDGDADTANVTLLAGSEQVHTRFSVSSLEKEDADDHGSRAIVVTDLTEQHERRFLSEALSRLQNSQDALQQQYQQVETIRKKLEQANAAKDDFLAALSHELRTPLTPVLLTANAMAVDPSLPIELRHDLEMIRRNVELEARLIDDLLDLTRITSGKLQIAAEPTDLHEVLKLALDISLADTSAKRLRFMTHLNASHHYVNAEAVRLQQVFWNLLRNAVKFTPGGGLINVATRNGKPSTKSESQTVVITVTDTGIGIPPDRLELIFNAFEQGAADITRRFGGLGLGLTITKQLVELHGGTIRAISRGLNEGSSFTITLPTIATPKHKPAAPMPATAMKTRSLKILLVEDHDDTRRNMTRLLTALHHKVVAAHDAGSALVTAKEETFDLVISDIGLPDESGLELMKKLKSLYHLPGICLSGYGMEEDIARSKMAGFSEHLTKPINFQRLEQAIHQASLGIKTSAGKDAS